MKLLVSCTVGLTKISVYCPDWSDATAPIFGGERRHAAKETWRRLDKVSRNPQEALEAWALVTLSDDLAKALTRCKVGAPPSWLEAQAEEVWHGQSTADAVDTETGQVHPAES